VGSILARGEAHVLRLSLIYALLDWSPVIRESHLRSALALWKYVERSAESIFAGASGDPIADRILEVLRSNGELGRKELHAVLGGHAKGERIEQALQFLAVSGKARVRVESTPGRSMEIWSPT
jgi:hypothetical protein